MKVAFLFILIPLLQVSARSYSQTVTISFQHASLDQIFKEIRKQTGYKFFYTEEQLAGTHNVSATFTATPLQKVLEQCFREQPVAYSILKNTVVVRRKKIENKSEIPAQVRITGTVTDASTGKPLPGVSVQVKGTSTGVATNEQGGFTLTVPDGAVLVISYLGYLKKEVTVNGQTVINVSLELANESLDQVVVVGYGMQSKAKVIGAVSQVAGKDVNNRAVPQLSQALTGQVPGVTIVQRTGQPGVNGNSIQIRGIGSFGGSPDALILVDGIPVNNLNNVDPNDVESISVLKDASAAAIYGARAANGVILVTTKTSKSGDKTKVSYNGYVGTQRATAYPDFVDSWEYATMMNEAVPGSYTPEQIQKYRDGSDPDNYPNAKYTDLVFKKSTLQTGHNISLSNAGKNTQYLLSFGYLYQNGIVMKNDFNRYNVRLNMTSNINSRLKLTTRLTAVQTNDKQPAPPATLDFNDMITIISQVIRVPPVFANKLSNGDWGLGVASKGTPVSYLDNASFYKKRTTDLSANLRLDWNVTDDLKLSAIGGYTQLAGSGQRFLSLQRLNANVTIGPANLIQFNDATTYKTLQQLAEYHKRFGNHDITVLAGHSFESSYRDTATLSRSGFPSNDLTQINAGSINGQTNNGTASEWALNSYFGRVQYSFDNKYLLEGSIRYDGSSRFPLSLRYAAFPSVAAGWRLGQERFIADNIKWIDELKVKASYGVLGNQNIGNYPYQNILVANSNTSYPFGGTIMTGAARTTLTDSTIHWESTRTTDAGMEVSVLNKLFTFSATYFDKYTYNILVAPVGSVSNVLGFLVGAQNSAKLKNSGWEFTVGHQRSIGQVAYSINANLSIINNKVIDLGVGNIKQPNGLTGNGNNLFIGYPMGAYYGLVADGLFTSQADIDAYASQTAVNPNPHPGDIRYKDISGPDGVPDGKVDAIYDRTVLGSTIPRYIYGINLGVNYKNFDLSVLLQGVADVKGRLEGFAGYAFYGNGNIQRWQVDGRWRADAPDANATYPRLEQLSSLGSPNTSQISSYWLRNASYLRIKNVQLGYNLPEHLLQKCKIQHLRIYASGENLFTFNKYPKGWDPEINTNGYYYPILANYTIGVNVNF